MEICLTEAGREALDEIAGLHVESVRTNLLDTLTPEQYEALGDAMAAIRDRLAPEHHEIGIDD